MKKIFNKKLIFSTIFALFLGLFIFNFSLAATATFIGEINDDGGDPRLYVWFEYGKTTSYGYQTPRQEKYGTGEFTATVSNLEECTTYHYRAVARHQNYDDTKYGEDKTFTTSCEGITVSLSASPSSGCKPLTKVDLKATLSGRVEGSITYYFDCQNDGTWEKVITTNSLSYTAQDLCDFNSAKTYTAKVRVKAGNWVEEASTEIKVFSCEVSPWVDLRANGSDGPLTIPYNSSLTLTWDSGNADYCEASGDWSGSKSTSGSQRIEKITSSPQIYILTCYGPGGFTQDSVKIYLSGVLGQESPTIQKKVRNLSDGQVQFFDSVFADPFEVLEFQLIINSGSGVENLRIKDVLPEKITFRPNTLKIDGTLVSSDITQEISLGSLSPNQTKTITFLADIAGPNQFSFGQTSLTNTATIYWNGNSLSDSAVVIVKKGAVAGAATGVSTGAISKTLLTYFLPFFLFLLILISILKFPLLNLEKLIDKKRRDIQRVFSENLLKLKIAQIKLKKFIKI
jgi:hypothetical protein